MSSRRAAFQAALADIFKNYDDVEDNDEGNDEFGLTEEAEISPLPATTKKPDKRSKEQACGYVYKLLRLSSKLEEAKTEEERVKLRTAAEVCKDFVGKVYPILKWEESPRISEKEKGVYTGFCHGQRKAGMSTTCMKRRTEEQKHLKDPAVLSNKKAILDLFKKELFKECVDAILKLRMPALSCDPSNQDRIRFLVQCQLLECAYACIYECPFTTTVGEKVLQLPSPEARKVVEKHTFPEDILQRARRSLQGRNKVVHNINTWPPLSSYTAGDHYQEKLDEDTKQLIRKRSREKEGEYVTNLINIQIWDGHEQDWENVVQVSPRAMQVDGIIERLKHLLHSGQEQSEEEAQEIREIILEIDRKSNQNDDYLRPENHDLADGLRKVLTRILSRRGLPTTTILTVELHNWENMVKLDPNFVGEVVADRVVLDEETGLSLVDTKSKHVMLQYKTPFTPYCDLSNHRGRMNSLKAQIRTQDFLCAVGLVSEESVERSRATALSYAMCLVGLRGDDSNPEGSFYEARYNALPKSHCRGLMPGVKIIADNLGRGVSGHVVTYMRAELGRTKFEKVLEAHGMQVGPDNPSPIELDCSCNGVCEMGRFRKLPCTNTNTDEEPTWVMLGHKDPNNIFFGIFTCRLCYRGWSRREHHALRAKKKKSLGCLSPAEEKQLQKFEAQREKHRQLNQDYMDRRIEVEGKEAVETSEKKRTLEYQSKVNNDPNLRAERNKAGREQYAQQLANGGKKKAGGRNFFFIGNNYKYSHHMRQNLRQSLQLLLVLWGENMITQNQINDFWNIILQREDDAGKLKVFYLGRNGNKAPKLQQVERDTNGVYKYCRVEYDNLKSEYLVKADPTNTKSRLMKLKEGATDDFPTVSESKQDILRMKSNLKIPAYLESVADRFYKQVPAPAPAATATSGKENDDIDTSASSNKKRPAIVDSSDEEEEEKKKPAVPKLYSIFNKNKKKKQKK